MKTLKNKLDEILQQIPKKEFENMVSYVKKHYTEKGFDIDEELLVDFFGTNFSTGIWYESLSDSISKKHYNEISKLEENDWEKSDEVGSYIGDYVIKMILSKENKI